MCWTSTDASSTSSLEEAEKERVELTLHEHDLRAPLSSDLVGKFDLVSADPPQSKPGALLFLERALDAVKPQLGHRIYCSLTPMWMGMEEYHSVLAFMTRSGFVTREILKSQMRFSVRRPASRAGPRPTTRL